jgi:hypothetical protein
VTIEAIVFGSSAGTFTTHPLERQLSVVASTEPPSFESEVQWEILDASDDQVASIAPDPASLTQGAVLVWDVPDQDISRWPQDEPHPGPILLDQKSIAFEIVAFVIDGSGSRWESAPQPVRQNEIDTIRQEYGRAGV